MANSSASSQVEIYTWSSCPYCVRAKALLDRKKVDYVEYNLDGDDAGRAKMIERTGGHRTLPQIYIQGKHVGGCDDLHALDAAGKLDPMLQPLTRG
jgi:glutaredoxin 3